MIIAAHSINDRSLASLACCLRVVLALQCFGVAALLFFAEYREEGPVFSFLWMGQKWPYEMAMVVERWATIIYLVAGLLLLLPCFFRAAPATRWSAVWQSTLLIYLFVWSLAIAVAGTAIGGEFMSEWMLAEHATRIIAPLSLLVLLPVRYGAVVASWRIYSFEWLLRLGVACTFFAHGLLAWNHAGPFVDLILSSGRNLQDIVPNPAKDWLGQILTQSHAELALTIIGLIDMLVAAAVLVVRWRAIAVYMVVWGAITAASRMTEFGWGNYPETLVRAANAGLPLALLLYWHLSRPLRAKTNDDIAEKGKRTNED